MRADRVSLRRPMLLVGAALPGLLLTACSSGGAPVGEPPTDPVPLTVETQDWTGWSRQQPKPTTRTVEVGVGERIEVEAMGDTVAFEVTDVEADRVSLSSDEAWSPRSADGGIDVMSTQTEFEVGRSEPLEVSTPTMDAGTSATISFA